MATTFEWTSVKDFGAKGDGITPDAVAINKALVSVKGSGKTLYFPAGTYMVQLTIGISLAASDKDISIVCDPSAIIKATTTFPANAKFISFLGSGGSHTVSWDGGTIDGTGMPLHTGSATSPDCLTINSVRNYFNKIQLSNLKIIQNVNRTSGKGDSCLFIAGDDISILNCIFQGTMSSGVYLSGTASGGIFYGERFYMSGCTFIDCNTGFVSKRLYKNHVIDGNFFQNCNTACAVGGTAGLGPNTPLVRGGRFAIISNNIVNNCTNGGIELRDSNNSIVSGNIVTDCYNFSYKVSGSQNCIVSSNYSGNGINYSASPSNAGIYLSNITDELPNNTVNTLISFNSLNNHRHGIYENAGVDYSTITDNIFDAVGTNYRIVGPNSNYGQKINLVPLSAAPAIKATGDIYLNSTTKKLQYYTGSAWLDL